VKPRPGKRKIAAVTTSRSDYAHLRWLLHDLSRHPQVDLRIIAMGPHLSPEFGSTGKEIGKERKRVTSIECLLSSDTDVGMAKTLGVATLALADTLGSMRPDLMILIADRYEMLAPASVALTLRIPIAHIEGGETTSGAIDDAVRNAITKMSHLHFACTRAAKQRLIAMGEQPWRVIYSGSLSIDDLRRSELPEKAQIEKQLGISLGGQKRTIVALSHPVTLMKDTIAEANETLAALQQTEEQILLIYPNADAGSRKLIEMAKRLVSRTSRVKLFINLDHPTYLGLLKNVDLLVGNSSSGVIESTSIGIPALNIGIRQRGREHAANVIDVPAKRGEIRRAIAQALSPDFRRSLQGLENPYGDGHASEIITEALTATALGAELLFKS
jgi:UDP-hydrolysing UDP-N-acetyl-D-glucosamine 2-epimerase